MKTRPIKKFSKEEIFNDALSSAEIEGINFNKEQKEKLWLAFQSGAKLVL